jgi:predicted RNA-binding Zn-ribbon protein involved in translation (DUF1610 family)
MDDIEESVSGFKVKGGWSDVVKHGEQITVALQAAGCSGETFDEWDNWRPKAHERLAEDIREKTAKQAHLTKGPGERARQSAGDDLQHASEKLMSAYEQLGDANEALDDWYGSLRYLGRAADSASRKAIRSIEDTVYIRVMTKISPFFFDNDLISANIQRGSILDNDSDYVFEININDDDLKVTVSEFLEAHEEVDRWHIETEPAIDRVEAAEGFDAPNKAGASLGYAVDNHDQSPSMVESDPAGGSTTAAAVVIPRRGKGNRCIGRDDTTSMANVKLNCSSCGHRWTYEGDDRYATCPNCGRSVQVKR